MSDHRSRTRVVGYSFTVEDTTENDRAAGRILRACPAVTEWHFGRGGFVWFNGTPGEELRTARDQIAALPGAVQVQR